MRLFRIVFYCGLLFISVLATGACALVTSTAIQAALPSPVAETPVPSVTVFATPRPVTPTSVPSDQWQTYENSQFGFRLDYPAGYKAEILPPGPGMAFAMGFSAPGDPGSQAHPLGRESGPGLGLTVYENPARLPLAEWFAAHLGDPPEVAGPHPESVFFYSPHLESHAAFQGFPSLKYESGVWPVKYETLVERGAWVVAFSYLRDYPVDYGPTYERMLSSLEFFETLTDKEGAATPALPTPTPVVCLDPDAASRELPQRQTPLEVRFISDGNVWAWQEGKSAARQISDTGDARRFSFSPDGPVVAFLRAIDGQDPEDWPQRLELWEVDRDGGNLRRLISMAEVDRLAADPHSIANTPEFSHWVPGTHQLVFSIYRLYEGIGGCCSVYGHWVIDADTLSMEEWDPSTDPANQVSGIISPDGRLVAVVHTDSLDLVNADGSNLRENVLSFPYIPAEEGGGQYAPGLAWAPDSQSLLAIVPSSDLYAADATFTTWYVPIDGSPARQIGAFTGFYLDATPSPNLRFIAYWKAVMPLSNQRELHIAKTDGSADVVYASGHRMEFLGWAPDSYHFVFGQFNTYQPRQGSVCGSSAPLVDPQDMPVSNINWVDAERFLFASGLEDGPRELRLGQVGEPSLRIGPFNGVTAYYEFNSENPALGQSE